MYIYIYARINGKVLCSVYRHMVILQWDILSSAHPPQYRTSQHIESKAGITTNMISAQSKSLPTFTKMRLVIGWQKFT